MLLQNTLQNLTALMCADRAHAFFLDALAVGAGVAGRRAIRVRETDAVTLRHASPVLARGAVARAAALLGVARRAAGPRLALRIEAAVAGADAAERRGAAGGHASGRANASNAEVAVGVLAALRIRCTCSLAGACRRAFAVGAHGARVLGAVRVDQAVAAALALAGVVGAGRAWPRAVRAGHALVAA